MSDALDEFDLAILEEAWEYLQTDNITLAIKVEKAVKAGVAPEILKQRYLGRAGEHRTPMAIRIENAAKFLQSQQQR